ncbi:hypothetical protein [Mycobacterium colombiense]|nr:hypothetical protein [Mycobacterium colombiense]
MTPRRVVVMATMAGMAAMLVAPSASADSTADLRSAVAAKRGGCPALQSDPVLERVAQRANLETQSYANHTARFQPMEDPMPTLRQLSYPAAKAKLLAGFANADQFADAPQKAIYGATLFGWDTIPDCSYTRYGADVVTDTNTGNTTAAIVLAGG